MRTQLLLAILLLMCTACASFNNPDAWPTQKEYEVTDIGWRPSGNWKVKWVESDTVTGERPETKLKPSQPRVENRLSDHETETAPAINPDF